MTTPEPAPKQKPPESDTSLEVATAPKSDPAEEQKQAEMRAAYILQQRRMQCGRGGCGDGLETF
ncbi:hypothetical protein [Rubripirellula reticaptiva]|uniref:Uncharacterized protein n=1 Tax=Rubripirellula reticaptiva TaxID=2528013 RepID=A0A5C6EP94_9BACT|nr:hypothetical protein [Rubripirellula reticaptiva]TWU49436.1 hypothetical protein Poly59_40510 [Rubripirellula reticaptiva]